jgi:error-prone DNA polymerase
LKAHPLALLRDRLRARRFMPIRGLAELAHGRRARIAGLVTLRQQPASAGGVVFITVEDESGIANLILWPKVLEAHRSAVLAARLLGVQGRVQREGIVVHVLAERLFDLSALLAELEPGAGGPALDVPARDFH